MPIYVELGKDEAGNPTRGRARCRRHQEERFGQHGAAGSFEVHVRDTPQCDDCADAARDQERHDTLMAKDAEAHEPEAKPVRKKK